MFNENALCALNNIGNSCFFNSLLQLLFNCNIFNKFIINNKINGNTINLYSNFISSYSCSSLITPNDIIQYISKISDLKLFSQECASEYLILLLNLIIDELSEYLDNKFSTNKSAIIKKFISKLFNIKIKKTIICPKCFYNSISYDNELCLYLSVLIENNNLYDLLNNYINQELSETNKWFCDKCNKYSSCNIKLSITYIPKYLIINLNRFTNQNNKNNNIVIMPFQFTLLNKIYQLRGFIFHSGNTNGGHYVYYGKKDKWYLFNDNNINVVDDSNIENIKNYGFIYLYVYS